MEQTAATFGKKTEKVLWNVGLVIIAFFYLLLVFPAYELIRFIARIIFHKDLPKIALKNPNSPFEPLFRVIAGTSGKAMNNRAFFYFLLPALGAFLLFVITPFFMGIYLSMTDWNGYKITEFLWFDNYRKIFSDVLFFYSFFRTCLYAILCVVLINFVAFVLALLVTQKLVLKNIYRAGFFMPNLIGGLILGYIWKFIFNNAVPVIFNSSTEVTLISNPDTAMFALMVVVTWQYAGYIMMIYIAALQNVPVDLLEASRIDGAGFFQRLRHITLPLIAQAFTISLFLTLTTSFKQFDTVFALTGRGGPAAIVPYWISVLYNVSPETPVMSLNLMAFNIWDTAYNANKLGVGQAKAVIFFLFLLVFSVLQVTYNKRREVEM